MLLKLSLRPWRCSLNFRHIIFRCTFYLLFFDWWDMFCIYLATSWIKITDCKADYVWLEGDAASRYVATMLDGWCMSSGIHMNVRTQGFQAQDCTLMRWWMLFTSPISLFFALAHRCKCLWHDHVVQIAPLSFFHG